ncbi:MAG TPA: efflux RND transporter permease subunit, partial [Candidatus Ozemobacteraceae bacterium]|nr:efflux RND transporter permease subunit [Candidatus Ozemobacteraceae bacterium]
MSDWHHFTGKPVYVIVFWLGVIAFGVMGYLEVPRDLFPDTMPPQVAVVTVMRGASAEDVNRLVTSIVDREIKGLTGLKKVTATSKDEISSINAEFEYGKNLGEAVNDVLTAVSRARRQLPVGVEEPQLFRITEANRPLLTLSIRPRDSQQHNIIEVRQVVENDLKELLLRLPGIGRVDVFGAHEAEVSVRVNHARLREYDLSIDNVVAILAASNLSVPGGYQETARGEVLVRTVAEAQRPSDLARLPIRVVKGGVLTLGDIASISLAMKNPRSLYHGDGEPAVALNVLKPEGGNSLEGILAVKSALPVLERKYPHLQFSVTTDQQPIIDKNFAGMTGSLFSAVWLTMLVVLVLLLEWRTALIVGVSIPLSFLTTFAFLLFSGYTLNMVTLSGLIIAVGMVVDASIVVVENVLRRLQGGEPGPQAVTAGTREVLFSIFGGTLTTVVVLVPLMFTGGYVQQTMRPLSLTISTTLIGSFVAAVTAVPLLLRWFFAGTTRDEAAAESCWHHRLTSPIVALVNGFLDAITEAYLWLLRLALYLRVFVLLASVAAFVLTVNLAMPLVGMELMPRMDTGLLTIRLDLPTALSWRQCREVLQRVEMVLKREPQVRHISSVMGAEPGQISFGAGGQLLQQVEMQVTLTTRDQRTTTIWEIMERWRGELAAIPEIVSAAVIEYGATPVSTTRAPIDVMITGRDPRVLDRLGRELLTRLKTIKGLRDLRPNWTCTKLERMYHPHLSVALQAGLSPKRLGELLQVAFSGRVVTKLKMEGFLDLPIRLDLGHESR